MAEIVGVNIHTRAYIHTYMHTYIYIMDALAGK